MKIHSALLVATLLWVPPLSAERLIPMDQFFISVETSDRMNRRGEGARLNVSVKVSRSAGEPKGSTWIDVDCYDLEASQRMLAAADLEAFLEAGDAAKKGSDFLKKVITPTYRGDRETTYEVVELKGKSMIRMKRDDESVDFMAGEAAKLRHALAEAKAGEAWFKKLLADGEMPDPSPEAKPPQSRGYYLNSSVGTIIGGGIGYEIAVSFYPFGEHAEYNIRHTLCFYSADGQLSGTTSGGWVEGLVKKMTTALEAVEAGKEFSFVSVEEVGMKYSVTANLKTNEADLVLQPGNFFRAKKAVEGHFNALQVAEIRKLIDACDERTKWFKANEHLFFEKPAK